MIYEIEQQPKMRIEFQDYDNNTLARARTFFMAVIQKMDSINADEMIFDEETIISVTDLAFVYDIINKLMPWDAITIEGKFKNGVVISEEGI